MNVIIGKKYIGIGNKSEYLTIPLTEFVINHEFDHDTEITNQRICKNCEKCESLHQLNSYLNLYKNENIEIIRFLDQLLND